MDCGHVPEGKCHTKRWRKRRTEICSQVDKGAYTIRRPGRDYEKFKDHLPRRTLTTSSGVCSSPIASGKVPRRADPRCTPLWLLLKRRGEGPLPGSVRRCQGDPGQDGANRSEDRSDQSVWKWVPRVQQPKKGRTYTIAQALKEMPLPHRSCAFILGSTGRKPFCRCLWGRMSDF